MKYLLSLLFATTPLWAKPLVLVSYYDAFGRATFNNSERVALELGKKLGTLQSPVEIKLCRLETKFDVAFAQLEKCLKDLNRRPDFILGLGETNCNLKIELVMKNLDKTFGADNAGVERNNTVIIPEAPSHLGLKYPLGEMFCAVPEADRKLIQVSTFAGTFVCNNTAFQMSHYYSDIPYGFIHVPSSSCRDLTKKTEVAVRSLEKMIVKASAVITSGEYDVDERLPVTKDQMIQKRKFWEDRDECQAEFYQKARGIDESTSFWSRF